MSFCGDSFCLLSDTTKKVLRGAKVEVVGVVVVVVTGTIFDSVTKDVNLGSSVVVKISVVVDSGRVVVEGISVVVVGVSVEVVVGVDVTISGIGGA